MSVDMSLQFVAYGLYLMFTVAVIFRLGHILHGVGETYIRFFFPQEGEQSQQINDLLLLGYYLFNIGYVVLVLVRGSEGIVDVTSCIEWVLTKIGSILLILGAMHANNMVLIGIAHRIRKIRV